jgi:polar amino acid transport system substrate-binding protein
LELWRNLKFVKNQEEIMKLQTFKRPIFWVIMALFWGYSWSEAPITKEQVTQLVDLAAKDIVKDASTTLTKITAGNAPYKDATNPALYVFVYDEQVVIVAHPKNDLVGRSYKGKPDVRGKKFRDDIVNGALANGTGWVDYSYQKPGETGIHSKTTYYKLITGSDGKKYIVCAGKYL